MTNSKKELKDFLEQNKPKQCEVVVLPDFFLDRLISLEWTPSEFSELIDNVAQRKGGSIDGVTQTEIRGGNAINVASALASLGAKVTPIICTSEYGLQQIKFYFRDKFLDTSHIKIHSRASITTALEFKGKKSQKTNVMLRDLGSLADFGPENLSESDFKLIEDAPYVCLFNWAGTLKFGTALAQAIFSRAKKGKGKTYYDTADPAPNRKSIAELMEKVLKSNNIDILSVNENEAIIYASLLDRTLGEKKELIDFSELAMQAARILASSLSARIDLHTTLFSATLKGKAEVVAPTFKVKILRATGAGDAWTAGNILGDSNGLSDESRLMLANAVSACYLSDPEGKHPTWKKLSTFLNLNA